MGESTVHHHLKMLKSARIVESSRVAYQLQKHTVDTLGIHLEQYLEEGLMSDSLAKKPSVYSRPHGTEITSPFIIVGNVVSFFGDQIYLLALPLIVLVLTNFHFRWEL
ncbi:hypothetical protein ACFQIC_14610 [Halobacillus seohaensis]|uniref:HTH arsR-type domain-containing protein n=2 Tax=Halobacillus seohaensis TaxID=447421 RepID=A0ABW2ELK0_9BACI